MLRQAHAAHEIGKPGIAAQRRETFMVELCQTEIHQLCLAARRHENVSGLDAAVDDAFFVRGVERVGDVNTDVEECIRR